MPSKERFPHTEKPSPRRTLLLCFNAELGRWRSVGRYPMGTARGKLLAKELKRQLPSRKEGESLSVRLKRWDGMRQQLHRSLCQLRGHERGRERERSADGGVLLKVCDGRESGSGRGRKRSRQVKRAVTVPLLEIRGVTDQDSFSVICHGRSGTLKV